MSQNADLAPAAGGERMRMYDYPSMTKTMESKGASSFKLNVVVSE